jgi:uncharacterized protein (TIGR02391 family)
MAEYTQKLVLEGIDVFKTRRNPGHPFLKDMVDAMSYQKWVLNCISFLKVDAPDHVEQIKAIYKKTMDYPCFEDAEMIYGIVLSADEYIKSKHELLTKESDVKKSTNAFTLDFLSPKLVEKCADHFSRAKYDECILNATKVVEVAVREAAAFSDSDVGVSLMHKAFKPENPILKYSSIHSEQEAVMHLFSGFIGVFKNPHSHRFLEIKDPLAAFEILSFANRLLNLVDNIKKSNTP